MRNPNDYEWCRAIERAVAAGDVGRVRALSWLAATLLDLHRTMPLKEWETLYGTVSQHAGIVGTQTLALVKPSTKQQPMS